MVRLEAASEAIRATFPDALVEVYAGVTALGDPAVLTLLLALAYWGHRREETATVVGYAFLGFALTLLFKELLAMPRPPESVRLVAEAGYGFPSGHAVAGTVVYGGIALEYGWLEEPPKALVAGVLALSVGLSRVVLGVHYLGDVLAGIALGVGVLAVGRALRRRRPAVGYALGGVVAVPAILVSGAGPDAVGVLGSCLGGVLGCRRITAISNARRRAETALLIGGGVAFVVALVVARGAVGTNPPVQFLLGVVLVAGVLVLPAFLDRVGGADGLRRLLA